jgi:hypothetical protein
MGCLIALWDVFLGLGNRRQTPQVQHLFTMHWFGLASRSARRTVGGTIAGWLSDSQGRPILSRSIYA